MIWTWLKTRLSPPDTPQGRPADLKAAQAAVESAQRSHEQIKQQGAEVSKVSASLRSLRERNHFGAAIEASMFRRGTR